MASVQPLTAKQVYLACKARDFNFTSSANLKPLTSFLGQERAEAALHLGLSLHKKGVGIFVLGPQGLGKRKMLRRFLQTEARKQSAPDDYLYVQNFADPRKPLAINLPSGLGKEFKTDLQNFILDLKQALPAAFDNEGFFERAEQIKDYYAGQQAEALNALAKEAEPLELKLILQAPDGYMFVPADEEGEPLEADIYAALPSEKRRSLRRSIDSMEKKLRRVLRRLAKLEKQGRQEQLELNDEVAKVALEEGLKALLKKYKQYSKLTDYLQRLEEDVLDNLGIFLNLDEEEEETLVTVEVDKRIPTRYQVNLLVSHDKKDPAPVIEEALPTYNNLLGHIETLTYQGTVATDFSLIRSGALHQANGGYLLLDALQLISQPYAWEGLKRALQTQCLRIEVLEKQLSVSGSLTLEPEAFALQTRVILLGDYETYAALQNDPEFSEIFNLVAEFTTELDRTPVNQRLFARFVASLAREEELLPLTKAGMMRVIEEASRWAEHQQKLSLYAADLKNLLLEANYLAEKTKQEVIDLTEVNLAVEASYKRSALYPEQLLESIQDDFIIISTQGTKTGQVNGLTLLSGQNYYYGQPSRITARVHYGSGEVLDIERSVHLGGAMHSKGVLILNGFLCGLFGAEDSLPLDASLVFEQSYASVDGDSASLAELLCLLSAMAEVPAKQNLAITGSINQLGEVQPIGGVNEKIEGFFAVCQAKGLTGDQGVILPQQNVRQLMLRPEVVAAIEKKQFHLYAVSQVEEAIELLLGMPALQADKQGEWLETSIYGKINARLNHLRDKDKDEAETDAEADLDKKEATKTQAE